MKTFTIFLIFICTVAAAAQKTYTVDDFSDRYFGKVYISEPDEVFSPGWIAIFDKRTKRQLIKVDSDQISHNLHDGKLVSNIKVLPYGEQSVILYEDYNFDGKKDLALMDGQHSCYHGPSFQIYLATNGGFRRSPEFTRLAQEYCGMFDVHHEEKKISTMTKSGCCSHQFSEFIVKGNRPVAVKIVEEDMWAGDFLLSVTEKNLVGGKFKANEYFVFMPEEEAADVIFSFSFDNKKTLRLVDFRGTLHYVFTDKDDKVELRYADKFTYDKEKNILTFKNGRTTYEVSAAAINVISPTVNSDMKAEQQTVTGSLSKLASLTLDNVVSN